MKKLTVNGKEHILLSSEDECPICASKCNEMVFSWNMFHGQATSSCCGAVFQLKDYYIENPTDEEKELLEALRGDFIEFSIKNEWVGPLKKAIQNTGIIDINNDDVIEEAKTIMAA